MQRRTGVLAWICTLLCVGSVPTMRYADAQTAAVASTQSPTLETLLPGVWRGVETVGYATYHHRLEVRKEKDEYVADGIAWAGMTEAQAQLALNDSLSLAAFPDLKYNAVRPAAIHERFAVTLKADLLTFRCVQQSKIVALRSVRFTDAAGRPGPATPLSITRLEEKGGVEVEIATERSQPRRLSPQEQGVFLAGISEFKPEVFSGRLAAPGIVARDNDPNQQPFSLIRFWRETALTGPLPLGQSKGMTVKLACLDGPLDHYTCYLPKSYDSAKPMPVLINMSPDGNAQPLSEKMADELGWIMVGLTESHNGPQEPNARTRDSVLFDLRRRFNIDLKHIYFSGFSGGARSASLAATSYPDSCAGLFCIGASCNGATPALKVPVYFLAGESDMNREEVTKAYIEEKRAGRITQMALHPGGHDWGRAEDCETALRWLKTPTPP